ncbi:MAG: hypothetical protein NZO16_04860, partial [Deltaproteobacteria bacterium]|nr:hypothetical protein [Deltaproteobacteria bacterium]
FNEQRENEASDVYFRALRAQLDELNNALRGFAKVNIFFVVLRSEGSYPSHSNAYGRFNWNCGRMKCSRFAVEATAFNNFFSTNKQRWRNFQVFLMPINDPATLAYEVPIFLLSFIERQRLKITLG